MFGGRITLLLLAVLALAGCGHGPAPISSGERYQAQADAVEDYRLGVGDKVRVTVYREADLSGDFSVAPDGTVALPLIGTIPALGRKPAEVAQEAQSRYGDGYLRDPRVTMEVITFRPYFILGEVTTPGDYPYVAGMTVLNAVATASGFTPRADRNTVRIRRQGAAEEETYRVTPELRVYPGDTIRVGERFF